MAATNQPNAERPVRIEFVRGRARKQPAVSYLRGTTRISVGEPALESFIHADVKPTNVLVGVGFRVAEETPVGDVIEAGFPASVVVGFGLASGMTARDVGGVVGTSERTMSRKVANDEQLGPAESDRAYRLFETVARAVHAFGDVDKALRWFRRVVPSLGGRRPLDLLRTEIGTREVLSALDRIEYGGVA